MNGLRLVLFGINSDAGLGAIPRMPLAFFTGWATASPLDTTPEVKQFPAGAAPVRETEVETV